MRRGGGANAALMFIRVMWAQPDRSPETYESVLHALRHGYRHIDTAALYRNEEDVGRAIRDSGVPREEVYVTTKLWNTDHGYDRAMKAFDASLSRLGLDYVDLYLMYVLMKSTVNETDRERETDRQRMERSRD
jgi:methylglyoxal/glyoxal reductase